MGIYLPIISNVIIAALLFLGVFTGWKQGLQHQVPKFIGMAISLVASYFLTPLLFGLLANISFITTMIQSIAYGAAFIYTITFTLLFIILMVVCMLVFKLIYPRIHKKDEIARMKIKGIDRASTKALRREEKKVKKLNIRPLSLRSKIGGAIVGLVLALVNGFLIMVPIHYICEGVAHENADYAAVTTIYDSTIYGVIDNAIGASDFILTGYAVVNN